MAQQKKRFSDTLLGPHPRLAQSENRRGARLFAALTLVQAVIVGVVLIATNFIYLGFEGRSIWGDQDSWVVIAGMAMMFVCYGLIRAGRYRVGVVLYIAVAALVPLTAPFMPDPNAEIGVIATAVIPIFLAAMVLQMRWMLVSLVAIVGVVAARLALSPMPMQKIATGYAMLVTVAVTGALVLIFRAHFAGLERDRLSQIRHNEEALRESEHRFRSLFEQSSDVVFIHDNHGRMLDVNQRAVEMLGYPREEMLAMAMVAYHPPEVLDAAIAAFKELIRSGHVRFESTFRKKDGSQIFVDISARQVESGSAVFQAVVRDITAHKQSDEALRESEALLRTLMDNMGAGVMIVDAQTHLIERVNHTTAELFGTPVEMIQGRKCHKFLCPAEESACPIADLGQEVDKSERVLLRTDGASIPVIKSVKRISIQGRDKLVETFIDITDRKRAEEEKGKLEGQLQQAQKMESVGRLAGGVAHDFNNMLGVILGHTEMALEQVDPAHPLHADLKEIRKAAERSADLTRQLLAFARKQTVAPRVLDLNDTIAGMLRMLERLIGEDVRLTWRPEADLLPVKVDPSQIDQILTNLCVNARDAIADVGAITIETGNAIVDQAFCADHPGYVPGDYVQLAVSDDGCGMNKETLSHLFEPFFTTKGIGKGTGLGLATVYGIVKQNHGFINACSEPGQGTTFTIYLPRHAGKTGQARVQGSAGPVERGQETILLVEDEPAILSMTTMMLGRQGYTVLGASTPGKAVRLAREHAGEIHLLITDVVMPEMNGRDLAGTLLSLYPRLKCLFMSGYTADVIAHHGVLDDGVFFLQKPFSGEGLAALVREALDSDSG